MGERIKETFKDGWPLQKTLALNWRSGSSTGEALPARVHLLLELEKTGSHPPAVEVTVFPPGAGVPKTPLSHSGLRPKESIFFTTLQPGARIDPISQPPYFEPRVPGIYTICARIPARSKAHDEIPARQTNLKLVVRLAEKDGSEVDIPLDKGAIHKQNPISNKIHPPKPTDIVKPEPASKPPQPTKKQKKQDNDTEKQWGFVVVNIVSILLVALMLAMAFFGVPAFSLFGF